MFAHWFAFGSISRCLPCPLPYALFAVASAGRLGNDPSAHPALSERGFLAEGAAVGCSQHTMEMFAAVMLHDIYTQTPYHNAWHAFSTLQCVYALLHPDNSPELRELSQPEVFSALVAALCHDAGHDGSNNPFHTNCNAFSAEGADVLKVHGVNIGFLYNDQSVLENMHAHHCFATAKKLRCDIFARAKHHGTFKTIRKCIVGQILSTDMIFHKEKTDKLAAINKLDLQVNTPYLVSALSCTSA